MQRPQDDYLAAYRSLKLTRDSDGVLVAEFHSNDGRIHFHGTRSYGVCRRLLPDRAGPGEQDCNLHRSRGDFIPEIDFSSFGNVADPHSEYALLANVIVAAEGATFHDVPHFAGGIVPGDGIFTTWSYRAGAGRAEAFLLNPQPLAARTPYEWGVVAEIVPNGKALSRARELDGLYLRAPDVTCRNTRVHFMQLLKERIVREVGYGLSLEGASAADLVKSMQAKSEPVAQKGKVA
jgi:hypothetical protein